MTSTYGNTAGEEETEPDGGPVPALTRTEAAYAHLATFQRGDVVDVAGEEFFVPGTIDTPQQHDGDDITAAYVMVRDCSGLTKVTVASLLDGMTVSLTNEVARGNVQYFDAATWAMRVG